MTDRYRYGRLPATQPIGLGLLDRYAARIPDAPATFDHTNGYADYHMLGNGPDPSLTVNQGRPVGDCGVVGTVNTTLIDSVETDEPFTVPTANAVVTEYLRYTHGQDSGVVLTTFLSYWHRFGLPWGEIAGWASVDFRDVDAMWAAANAFGCLYVGIAVPAPAQQQFAAGEPWDLTGTRADQDIEGGHCVVIVSRTSTGGELITWGRRQAFTTRWWAAYGEECHVAITPSQVERNGNGYGLDMGKLQHDLALCSG
jgi:hypothetical protein